MPTQTLWISPADYRLASPGLAFVDTPGPRTVEIAVKSSSVGPGQWIALPLALPGGAVLTELELCYRSSAARTAIRQVRIAALREPGTVTTLFQDATRRNSTTPVCEKIVLPMTGRPKQPSGPALTLELELDIVGADTVTLGAVGCGVGTVFLPPVGDENSELTAFAGRIEERDLSIDLGWQGTYSVDSLCSRLTGGGSSYSLRLAQPTARGSKRFYVPTLMGLFPGQRLKIDLLESPLFTVDLLGQDATGPFFDAKEAAPRDIPKEAPLYNKHNVNVLSLSDTSNSDNQGATVNLNRRDYGAGDVFLIAAVLEYQSNVYSGLGDEGGVGCAVDLKHDLESFHGVVETWTQNPGRETTVVYKPTGDAPPPATRNTQKLGTSRPLINLNERKWKRDGVANVVRPHETHPKDWLPGLPAPDHVNGCILIRPETVPADWRQHVGDFIALVGRPTGAGTTDASEYYQKDEETPTGKVAGDVYRWWFITDVQDAGGGRAYLFVDRAIQRTHEVVKSGPLLFRDDNYTDGKVQIDERTLRYIIAPGAWVSDVRHGVAGNILGNEGAQPTDPRRILLAPGQPELAAGDPITNPPGPDVALPTAFRARQFHHFPAPGLGAGFLSENFGRVQVGSGLAVAGGVVPKRGETIPDALRRVQKDQRPHYSAGVWITAPSEAAIRLQGYTQKAAIELWQKDGDQKIVWLRTRADGSATLHADRTNGRFIFANVAQRFEVSILSGQNGLALTTLQGLSGTSTAASNLRGRQAVEKSKTGAAVRFAVKEPDAAYHLFLQCSWFTQSVVVTRSETGFEAQFSAPAPVDASFDWLLVR